MLGTHVEQAGQLVDQNYVRFDFTHFSAMTDEELRKVENRVNEVILENIPVVTREMKKEDAQKLGAMMLFGEKYGDIVRVVSAGDFSVEFCGGTHADATGKLGLFKIVSENSVAAGVRRIEAVTGRNVLKYIDGKNAVIANTAAALKVSNENELAAKAQQTYNELKEAEKTIRKMNEERAAMEAKEMLSAGAEIDGLKLVVSKVDAEGKAVRDLADKAKEQGDDVIAVLAVVNGGKATFACACGKDAIAKGANAGKIVRAVAQIAGGNGGGRPDSAMAGGKDVSKVPEALEAVEGIVRGMLK